MYVRSILILFLISTLAMAQGSLPTPKGGVTIYVVEPGDTMWDISDRFFSNPLLWPRLWAVNTHIDNPHRIYPGDVLSLKGKSTIPTVKIEPKTKKVSFKDIEPPPPVYYYSRGGTEGFITPDEWEHMGTILTSEPPKILLGEGDMVYVNVGTKDHMRPGDLLTVFRTGKVVLHPITGRKAGHKVAILGIMEIVEVLGKRQSVAKIVESYREITRGARVRPLEPFVKEVVMKKGTLRADGFIIDTKNNVELTGRNDIVYIDLGRVNEIVPGHTLSIFTLPRKSYDPDLGRKVTIPGAKIGRMVVLEVREQSSTAIIMESTRQVQKGNIVSLDI